MIRPGLPGRITFFIMKNFAFHHSPAYDLVFSLARLAQEKYPDAFTDFYSDDLLNKYKTDDNLNKWLKKTRALLTPEKDDAIGSFFNNDTDFHDYLAGCICYYDLSSIPAFIKHMEGLTGRDLVLGYLVFLTKNRSRWSVFDENAVNRMLTEPEYALQVIDAFPCSAKRKWELMQMCREPDKTRAELMELLHWYYQTVYQPHESKIDRIIRKVEKEIRQKLKLYGKEYLNLLLMAGKDSKLAPRISLALTFFGELGFTVLLPPDDSYELYVIGYRHMDLFVERKHTVLSNVLAFKALADETRQNLIRLLAEKEWYGEELAQKMDLSNSTISYHLNILVVEGFARLHRVDNRTYISLNKDYLRLFLNDAYQRMIGED